MVVDNRRSSTYPTMSRCEIQFRNAKQSGRDAVSETVKAEIRDGILVLTIDNPPVNALSHSVRAGLQEELAKAKSDAGIKAIVLACAGRSFISGADIREFGKPPQAPGPARNSRSAGELAAAGRRRDPRQRARRRSRNRAVLPFPHRHQGHQPRPAGSEARPAAGRRRHAAPAARGRSGEGRADDRLRRPDQGRRGLEGRPGRRAVRRRPGEGRRGVRPQGGRREAPAEARARRRFQARGGEGRSVRSSPMPRRPPTSAIAA